MYSVHARQIEKNPIQLNNPRGCLTLAEGRIMSDLSCITSHNANTSRGLYRDYNEDRVDIITNILAFDESTGSE